jgi:hypothetical protein
MCYRNIDRVLFISFGIYFLSNATNIAQNIISQVLKDDGFGNLGFYALGVMYATFGVCSMFANVLIKKFGYRLSFFIGLLSYLLYLSV